MSTRPQPTQKQMILQQVMLAVVVFLGLRLMCQPPQQATETRSAQDILGHIHSPLQDEPPTPPKQQGAQYDFTKGSLAYLNATLMDFTAGQVNTIYQNKIDEELEKKKKGVKDAAQLRQLDEQAEKDRFYGVLLVADAQLKDGIFRNDVNRIRNAFTSIQGWGRKYQGTSLWTQRYDIPPPRIPSDKYAWTTMSGQELEQTLIKELTERNRSYLVYGLFPGYRIIDFLVNLTGSVPAFSYAFAAFLLALCVRAIIFPLAQKQLMWGRKMQQLAPLVKEIRAQFTDKNGKVTNQQELQQRTMALYQEYGINPLAGCLPAMVQFPLFITVYQFMLQYQFAFRNGTFLWINPSTSASSHGFLAPNLGERDYLLIIIYGITMVISTLLMPVSDPTQVKQQRIMGVGMGLLFTFFMFTGAFPTPAAFVLYWVFTNLLATAQSLRAYRMPLPPLEKVNTKAGGVFPMPPFSDPKPNGKTNGTIKTPTSTGTPAKHRPKKRK